MKRVANIVVSLLSVVANIMVTSWAVWHCLTYIGVAVSFVHVAAFVPLLRATTVVLVDDPQPAMKEYEPWVRSLGGVFVRALLALFGVGMFHLILFVGI